MSKQAKTIERSKNLIKKAFLELWSVKPSNEITVAEIAEKANISRSTFYAHYRGVHEVIAELQNFHLTDVEKHIDKAFESKDVENVTPLLESAVAMLRVDLERSKIIFSADGCEDMKYKLFNKVYNKVLSMIDEYPIKNREGFLLFVKMTIFGAMDMLRETLLGRIDKTFEEVIKEISSIYSAGVKLYL